MNNTALRQLEDGRVEIDLEYLVPDTVLAWPTFDENGEMVHNAYQPFSRVDIDRLRGQGKKYLYYTRQKRINRESPVVDLTGYLDQEIYQGPRTIQLATQKHAVGVMQQIVRKIGDGREADYGELKQTVDMIFHDIHSNADEVINLLDIQNYDDYTYTHSINVGVVGMVLAKRMKLEEQLVSEVGLAGFLHDLGKLRIPQEIINKPGPLTDEEFRVMRQHPRHGYEMIKDSPHISDFVRRLVLFHHERADGSGYPLGLNYEKLGDFSFIVAISDFYDALTTERAYKQALTTSDALKMIMKQAIVHFPQKIVQRFMADMKDLVKESNFYDVGMLVLLNTREVGRVVDKDSLLTTRPVLDVLTSRGGDHGKRKTVRVDLNYDGSRSIIKILTEKEIEKLSGTFPD